MKCPLCEAKLIAVTIDSGNSVVVNTEGVIGVALGSRSLSATCANGCYVTAQQGSKPTPFDGCVPVEHRAMSSGALKSAVLDWAGTAKR